MTKLVNWSRPGTPPSVRVISGAWGLPLEVPAVVAAVPLEAELLVLALLLRKVVVALALLVHLPVLAQLLQVVVVLVRLAEVAVPLHRSFSAAMAGRLMSAGTPLSAPVQRSKRKPMCRPCPLTCGSWTPAHG